MTTASHTLEVHDRASNKKQAAGFWGFSTVLTVALLAVAPPTVALGKAAGLSIASVLAAAVLVYIEWLRRHSDEDGEPDLFVPAILAALGVGLDQWLAGGLRSPLQIVFFVHVLGSAAVLPKRQRRIHLAVISLLVIAPLVYGTFTWRAGVTAIVFILMLLLEAALLAQLGDGFRAQRAALLEAEQDASRRAVTDALTGLGNRRAVAAELAPAVATAKPDSPLTLVCLDLDGFKIYNDRFGHLAGDALLERLGRALGESVSGCGKAFRLGGDEFCVMLDAPASERDALVQRVVEALSEQGAGFDIRPSHGVVVVPQEAGDAETALQLADERMYADKEAGRPSPAQELSRMLLRVAAVRERSLSEGSVQMGRLARAVALKLEVPRHEADLMARAAELHDLGKLAIPEAILHKPGPLDQREWDLVRQHSVIGERILASSPWLQSMSSLVRASHERWDGTGYPDGASGNGIPLASRIIAVCDAFLAMLAERPFRPARNEADAIEELRRCAGSQFDPAVVDALLAVWAHVELQYTAADLPELDSRDVAA
jgi:diguanylate cyclase (GGDEF)-like protein